MWLWGSLRPPCGLLSPLPLALRPEKSPAPQRLSPGHGRLQFRSRYRAGAIDLVCASHCCEDLGAHFLPNLHFVLLNECPSTAVRSRKRWLCRRTLFPSAACPCVCLLATHSARRGESRGQAAAGLAKGWNLLPRFSPRPRPGPQPGSLAQNAFLFFVNVPVGAHRPGVCVPVSRGIVRARSTFPKEFVVTRTLG